MTRIDVVTGFLGAGKTTFLSRYYTWLQNKGLRVAIVENEFGSAGIDTAILKNDLDAQPQELTGGCICCSLKPNFYDLLRDLAYSQKYDRILVEPSGVFNLDDYFDVVDNAVLDIDLLTRGSVITIIDPSILSLDDPFQQTLLFSQMHSANSFLVSKLQTTSETQTKAYAAKIDAVFAAHQSVRQPTQQIFALPWSQLTDKQMQLIDDAHPIRAAHTSMTFDHSNLFCTASIGMVYPYEPAVFEERLLALPTKGFGNILRIKGFAKLNGSTYSVNCTPTHLTLMPCQYDGPYTCNVIGNHLNRKAIRDFLSNG